MAGHSKKHGHSKKRSSAKRRSRAKTHHKRFLSRGKALAYARRARERGHTAKVTRHAGRGGKHHYRVHVRVHVKAYTRRRPHKHG